MHPFEKAENQKLTKMEENFEPGVCAPDLTLTEADIPGASLPSDRELSSFTVSVLKCWLACSGACRQGTKAQLIER